jgi:hypothetical protein
VFVLGITLIVTVLGMGALTLSRVSGKTIGLGNDWEQAGTLAFSATEHAVSHINAAAAASPMTWRAAFVSRQTAFTQTVGRGTFSWALKDETDGNLAADYLRVIRIYGIGTVGSVTRVYSVQIMPGGSPLDVLRTALHSTGAVKLGGSTQSTSGPISSAGNIALSGSVRSSLEAMSVSGSASGLGSVTTPAPAKRMPSASVFDSLMEEATAISYASLSGGKMQKRLLSATANPYGAANAKGIYSISLAGNESLTITNCRIVGTLLIKGANKNTIKFDGPIAWEAGPAGLPIVIISAKAADISFSGNPKWLTENDIGVNLNPAGTPYDGSTDSDKSDSYPPYYGGIIHVTTASTNSFIFKDNAYVTGTVIAACPVETTGTATFGQDSAAYADPPFGYAVGDAMTLVPGTWRWDTLP